MLEFSFAEVLALLARHNWIASEKWTAFAGRLKALQKQGVPVAAGVGRGKTAAFTLDQVFQMAMAVELAQCGVQPKVISSILTKSWWSQRENVMSLLRQAVPYTRREDASEHSGRWTWYAQPTALNDLVTSQVAITNTSKESLAAYTAADFTLLTSVYDNGARNNRRAIMINPAWLLLSIGFDIIDLKRTSFQQMCAAYAEIEEGLIEVADLFDMRLDLALASESDAEAIQVTLAETARFLVEKYRTKPASLRAVDYMLKSDANEELRWVMSNDWSRPPITDEIREIRRRGQEQLAEVGLIVTPNQDFGEPVFTRFGADFLKSIGVAEGTFNVDP